MSVEQRQLKPLGEAGIDIEGILAGNMLFRSGVPDHVGTGGVSCPVLTAGGHDAPARTTKRTT
jgi:hypothetical protein